MSTLTPSSYLKLLPAIYSESPGGGSPFLGEFLLAFEQILSGLAGANDPQGLEPVIASIAGLFDPKQHQEFFEGFGAGQDLQHEFLEWLSGWVALGLRADWTTDQKRKFLANIVRLYRRRGTKKNLADLLSIYTRSWPTITEGPKPHHFHVTISILPSYTEVVRMLQIAEALIELQKPAHTTFDVDFVTAAMQIGVRSTIGVDTWLGTLDDVKAIEDSQAAVPERRKSPTPKRRALKAAPKRTTTRRGRRK